MSIKTLSELFLLVAEHDKPDCMLHKVDGKFTPVSTATLVKDVQQLAKALRDAGVKPGDKIGLMAENGPHWPTVDFATLCIGAVLVPIYPTLTPDQAAYIANDSSARILFVQGDQRFADLESVRDQMSNVEDLIFIGGDSGTGKTLADMIAGGQGADPEEFATIARERKPDDLATFIYTSGTTGNPKGVMLTHGNIVSNMLAALERLDIRKEFSALSFLPLSHSFERTTDYCYFYRGCSIAYAESVQAVAQNLQEVRPQIFVSVPRVYEKVLAKVQENVAKGSALQQKIFKWAIGVGRATIPYRLAAKTPPGLLGIKLAIADSLVFGKIRARLGGRFQYATSGGAPLARDVAEFFWGIGVPIFEGYGLSETSPVLTVNYEGNTKLGSVGKVVPGVEVRIAEDGEILAKGPNIMVGYHNLPEATAEAIDDDGWFHTGDIGEFDENGFLSITDRKKELIVNAYGKNIAPAPVENTLKGSRFIGQVMVIGDRRKFLTALVVPDFEVLETWATSQGLATGDMAQLVQDPKVRKLFENEMAAGNSKLAKYERVGDFALMPEEWTIEGGEMTPTLKIKRRIINKKYADVIEGIYEHAGD